jgi:hypothetical protein
MCLPQDLHGIFKNEILQTAGMQMRCLQDLPFIQPAFIFTGAEAKRTWSKEEALDLSLKSTKIKIVFQVCYHSGPENRKLWDPK